MSEDQTSGPRRAATPDDIPDQDDGAGLDDTPDDATPRPRRGASADEPPSAEPAGQESPSEDSPTQHESPTEHESADGQWHEQGGPADDQTAGAGPEEQAAQPPMIEDPAADDHPAAGPAAGGAVGEESPADDTAELEPSADQPELDYGPGTSQEEVLGAEAPAAAAVPNPFARPGSQSSMEPGPIQFGDRGVVDQEAATGVQPAPRRSAESSTSPTETELIPPPAAKPEVQAAGTGGSGEWFHHHRRTLFTWLGAALVVALVLSFVIYFLMRDNSTDPSGTDPDSPSVTDTASLEPPVSVDELMSLEDAEKIDPDATWAIAETHEQKSADMLRVACLSSSDEDVNTLWTLQRAFGTNDNDKLAALHQIDVFASEEVASQVQEQRAAAMASCDEVPMHIVSSSKISNLADDVLQITVALEDDPADLHTLVLARTGSAITMVDVVRNSKAVGVEAVTDAVVRSLSEFCEAVDGTCPDDPEVKKSIPPPTEPEGWLQTADFPRITPGAGLWTATEPTKLDSKGMGCEDMTLSSASDAQEREQRTYLLTQDDNTPSTFGVDEMIFTFDKADDAKSFADKLGGNLANCKDKLLNAKVSADSKFDGKGADDVEFNGRTMTIKLDTSSDDAVLYQLAVSRVDKQVSYLLTSVTDDYKFDEEKQFQALAQRAAQRQSQNQ